MNNSDYQAQVQKNIAQLGSDHELKSKAWDWAVEASAKHNYTYNFEWAGLPIIQFPQDIVRKPLFV